ncbi:MAG: DUF1543 domain-containing protein [Alphaproteobacteria bacterium]|nr:DUF1543 domain-containing protein [Alphaproteobacteria bacterium]
MRKLFAVYLGGRAPNANTELHDVVFATGARIEDTYPQLLEKWFGNPVGLHLDSWLELDVVDGYRVSLSDAPSSQPEKLFFVNLGAYDDNFTELHANGFYVAADALEAKKRALKQYFTSGCELPHKDDLHDIDDCIALESVNGLRVTLTKTGETSANKPNNGYHIVPKDVIAAWMTKL